jgi:serine/threonine protein kinase
MTIPPSDRDEDFITESLVNSGPKSKDAPGNESEPSGDADTESSGMGRSPRDEQGYDPRINPRFRYRLDQKIGSGGFAIVYAAFDRQLKRHVAYKITKDSFSNRQVRKKFLHEARTIASLDHPHILPVYDVGITPGGEVFVVTKIIPNGDLAKLIRARALSRSELLRVAACVADALHHAHKNRVIHRDVKPGNILVDSTNHPYLTDFGLALREHRKLPEEFAGTVAYMSPEQARNELHRLDGRTDIYSLGIVIYEMLTNIRPYVSSNPIELMEQVKQARPKPVREIDESIPEELENIVFKCLSHRIADRYSTAADLAKELRAFLERFKTIDQPQTAKKLSDRELQDSDVIISYAQADDIPSPNARAGWVSTFRKNITVRVEQLLGESVKIVPLASNRDEEMDETLVDSVGSTKTLVSVISPTFTTLPDCQRLIERFATVIEKKDQTSRLISVVKAPIAGEGIQKKLKDVFSRVREFEFFEHEPLTGKTRELDEASGEETRLKYFERIYDVADAIFDIIKSARRAENSHPGSRSSDHRVVYLAETTSDLALDREVLVRELTAKRCIVLPDLPLTGNLTAIEEKVKQHLATASICVHPVGAAYGLIPEGSLESIVAIQYRIASTTDCPQIIWIPRDRVIQDSRQEEWIKMITSDPEQSEGIEIIEDRISTVKDVLLSRILSQNATLKFEQSASGMPPRLYLICDPADEDRTAALEEYFYSHGIEVQLPSFQGEEEDCQAIHLSNLRTCDGALIYYGTTTRHWVDFNARELIKATGYRDTNPIPVRAVFISRPIDSRKDRYKSLTTDVIREGEAGNFSELTTFVEQLMIATEKRQALGSNP